MKKILLILLLAAVCYGQEKYNYLIDRRNFASPYSVEDLSVMGIQSINIASGQPFRITSLTIPNTVYVLISVTPKDNDERTFFKTLDSNNYITKISSGNVITKRTRFGDIQKWEGRKFNDLPEDFNKDFSVIESTP